MSAWVVGLDRMTAQGPRTVLDFDWTMNFARVAHEAAGQHGYFDDHVMRVYRKVESYNVSELTRIAALLHDVLEDTAVTHRNISDLYGQTVAQIVWAVTDEPGRNRKDRKAKTYWKIRSDPNATLIKLCDRWDNMNRCLYSETRHGEMYAKEHYTFKCALWEPSPYQTLWDELDVLAERLKVKNRTIHGNPCGEVTLPMEKGG